MKSSNFGLSLAAALLLGGALGGIFLGDRIKDNPIVSGALLCGAGASICYGVSEFVKNGDRQVGSRRVVGGRQQVTVEPSPVLPPELRVKLEMVSAATDTAIDVEPETNHPEEPEPEEISPAPGGLRALLAQFNQPVEAEDEDAWAENGIR